MNVVLAVGLAATLQFAASPDKPTGVRVKAMGAPEGSTLTFHVRRDGETGPAMFASVRAVPGGMMLEPSFGLEPGFTYVARLRKPDGTIIEEAYRAPPARESPAPSVVSVWPANPRVPANLLKFYIEFSAPMREGRAIFDQIHLLDDAGNEVEAPWRRQELWSEDARRLSLWIHPGRVKRGVNLRESLGPVLQPDRRYRLVIDGDVRSAEGVPMGRRRLHSFQTTAADHEMPDPHVWKLTVPRVGTSEPLRVVSPEPLDHALLRRCQWVEDRSGARVAATVKVAPSGREWNWTPVHPWGEGAYRLGVNEWLEDLAGNTPARPFERDVNEPETRFETIRVPFEIR